MPKTIRSWQTQIHALARESGWWETERPAPEVIALCHAELSEALEEFRSNRTELYYDKDKPEGMFVELADAVIRILDFCEHHKVDLEHLIALKHQYNKTRPYRHGGKKA